MTPSEPQNSSILLMSYGLPAGEGRLGLNLMLSNSNTATSLGGATVTRGETVGLRYRRPLPGSEPGFSHGWTLGLDWKDSRSANHDVAGVSTATPALRYPVLSVGYDLFSSSADGQQISADVSLTMGSAELGGHRVDCPGLATPVDPFACRRAGSTPSFQALHLNLQGRRPVFAGWEASLRAQLQLSQNVLASAEQFAAGGADSVRGYYESEQVADQGLALRAELATPRLASLGRVALSALVFGDRAWLRSNLALPTEPASIQLGSLGFSLRGQAEGLQLHLDYAVALLDTLKADSSGTLVPASGRASRNGRRWDLGARYAF